MADSRAILKAFFETGDVPTEAQFASLIDSLLSLVNDSNLANGIKIKSATDGKIEFIIDDTFYQFTTDGGNFLEAFLFADPNNFQIGLINEFIGLVPGGVQISGSDVLTLFTTTSNIGIRFDSTGLKIQSLPTFADNAAALIGGLVIDNIYKTASGELRIVV